MFRGGFGAENVVVLVSCSCFGSEYTGGCGKAAGFSFISITCGLLKPFKFNKKNIIILIARKKNNTTKLILYL